MLKEQIMALLSQLSKIAAAGLILTSTNVLADTNVKIYTQNIFAHVFCKNADSTTKFKNYIKDNQFDFILTQEYEGECAGLFDEIKSMGYTIATGNPGDSTLFYKNTDWTPQTEYTVDTTYNTPDGWGHDGTRKAVIGVYQKNGTGATLAMSTAHLCVAYPGNGKTSECVKPQPQAHAEDFQTLMNQLAPNANWLIAGDMNAPVGEKNGLYGILTQNQAKNVDELNNQNFDMAFYKGDAIQNFSYKNTADALPNISDHNGFVLSFTLKD
jgi:hypothetical protein